MQSNNNLCIPSLTSTVLLSSSKSKPLSKEKVIKKVLHLVDKIKTAQDYLTDR